MRQIALPIVSVASMAFAASAWAGPEGDWQTGFGHMMWNGGHGLWGGLMMLLFWGLVIGLVVLAVRGFSGRSDAPRGNSALDVLKERYARGEIDEEEYERRKERLER